MIKFIVLLLSSLILCGGVTHAYDGGTTAAAVISGGIIKSKHNQSIDKKYKRKDCPVCKGKGWYMSGDDIKRIECQYCEPDQESTNPHKPRIIRR